jgi:DnaK suppressor protein
MPKSSSNADSYTLRSFEPYKPKKGEEYMSANQKEHFKQLLLTWRRELMEEVDRTMSHLKDEAANFPDPADRASQEEEFSLELRTRDRERKLIRKIDQTIDRIDERWIGMRQYFVDHNALDASEARCTRRTMIFAAAAPIPGIRFVSQRIDNF